MPGLGFTNYSITDSTASTSSVLSLRDVLDAMTFGMAYNVEGFNALSVPVFISNYLFDLFSEFFLILTLFALAIMAFDGLKRGMQSIKEDAVNLSLVIITVFVILQFKDNSVKYGDSSSYGLVTVYAGLLKTGEDIADALTYAILYNGPNNGSYSPIGKGGKENRPDASTPLGGIVQNSFFNFVVNKGAVNQVALEKFLAEREQYIKNQENVLAKLFQQDSYETVLKNIFNIAHGTMVLSGAKKFPQSVIYTSMFTGVSYGSYKEYLKLEKQLKNKGIPADKAVKIVYKVTDSQPVGGECLFVSFLFKNGKKKIIDFKNADKVSKEILTMEIFDNESPGCTTPSRLGKPTVMTYPYVLSDELKSISYFWNKIYKNMEGFKKDEKVSVAYIKEDESEAWDYYLNRLKKLSEFYKQAAELVKNGFPINAYKEDKYSLIFMKNGKTKKKKKVDINYPEIVKIRNDLLKIWNERIKLVEKYKNKKGNDDLYNEFFSQISSDILPRYIDALHSVQKSLMLFDGNYLLNTSNPLNMQTKLPSSFDIMYKRASTLVLPYLTYGVLNGSISYNSTLPQLYNTIVKTTYPIYKTINETSDMTAEVMGGKLSEKEIKNAVKKNTEISEKNGPSLNQLVFNNYGYNPKVDLIFPGKKISVKWDKKKLDDFLNGEKNAYQKKIITWVDLGYYFSVIKAYTSKFIIFTTYALANDAFTSAGEQNSANLKKAIELANVYANSYQKHFSDEAKMKTISESVGNTMAFVTAAKSVAKNMSILNLGVMIAGLKKGLYGFIIFMGALLFQLALFAGKIAGTYVIVLLLVVMLLKLIIILLPAGFWMIAVLNWFFKSAMMVVKLPINVFLMFFKSRRQVFFQALWKLLAQMLTPVSLVATFFVVVVFTVEIDFLLSYFIPFLNDNVLAYFLTDANMQNFIEKTVSNEFNTAKELFQNNHQI